jgi:tripartite-type tricarboxylate transporter receptor subunit TctC
MLTQHRRGFLASLAAGLGALPHATWAQAPWPNRPIKLIVPAAAGGASDRLGRMLIPELVKSLGQPVVVDNRAGGGGSLGTGVAVGAAADGYTLLISGVFNAINAGLQKLPYDFTTDFVHVAQLAYGPNVLVARPDFPVDNVAQLVARAKTGPGTINYASGGVGTSGHLAMEIFQRAAGVQLTHVAYRGGALAMQDLLAGVVPLLMTNQDAALPHIKAGKLKALAITSAQRNPAYPQTQTFAEAGYSDVLVTSWAGLAAPKGTPAAVIDRLRSGVLAALQRPDVRQPLEADGWVVATMKPSEFEEFVRSETTRMTRIIRDAQIKVE